MLLLPSPLFAGVWEERSIDRIEVIVNEASHEAEWRAFMGIQEGDRYQTRKIRETVQQLYKTGKIAHVRVEVEDTAGALVVTFQLQERIQVTAISLSGNNHLTEQAIYQALGFTPGQPLDKDEWDERQDRLRTLYKREGYFEPLVTSTFRRIVQDPLKREVALHIHEGKRARIRHIIFSGNPYFSDRRIYSLMRSRTSRYFSQTELEEDIERIRADYKKEGYGKVAIGPPPIRFMPEDSAVDIILPIEASIRTRFFFHPFDFRRSFSPNRFEPLMAVSEASDDLEDRVEEAARAIERLYRDQGYPFATVSTEIQSVPEKNVRNVHFTLTRGPRTKIRDRVFSGNATFPKKRLTSLVQLKVEGIFTQSRYTEIQLQEDADNLTRFYKQNGFQAVQVHPDVQFDEKKEWATLRFQITEGPQTKIQAVVIEGETPFSSSALLEIIGLREGDPFYKDAVREGARRILTALARLGYIDAKVDSDVTDQEGRSETPPPDVDANVRLDATGEKGVTIRYRISPGQPVYFGSLSLFGNEKTRNVTLLREMLIHPGDPYDYEKILKSQERLYQTGLFSGIRFDPVRDPNRPTIQDMHLTVVEQPRWMIEWGPGYGDREGLRGFIDIGHRNLWGSGRAISARASASQMEHRYSLNYKEPRVLPYDVDSSLSGISFFIPRASFDEKTHAGVVGFERSFSSAWKGSLQYQYEDKEISHVQPGIRLTDQDVGQVIMGSLNFSLTHDTRNDSLYPHKGSLVGVTLRNAAQSLGSHVQMVKVVQQGSLFFSPLQKVTFALSERLGIAKRFGETTVIPLSERFFLGGQSTVRGYDYQMLGDVGETLIDGQPTGGNVMAIFNEEVRIPLGGSSEGALFFDHGRVGRDENKLGRFKSTTGVGFRYNTPAGPLRLDWGYKLDREPTEASSKFHFTLGHAF